jgi:hypothetical protein
MVMLTPQGGRRAAGEAAGMITAIVVPAPVIPRAASPRAWQAVRSCAASSAVVD